MRIVGEHGRQVADAEAPPPQGRHGRQLALRPLAGDADELHHRDLGGQGEGRHLQPLVQLQVPDRVLGAGVQECGDRNAAHVRIDDDQLAEAIARGHHHDVLERRGLGRIVAQAAVGGVAVGHRLVLRLADREGVLPEIHRHPAVLQHVHAQQARRPQPRPLQHRGAQPPRRHAPHIQPTDRDGLGSLDAGDPMDLRLAGRRQAEGERHLARDDRPIRAGVDDEIERPLAVDPHRGGHSSGGVGAGIELGRIVAARRRRIGQIDENRSRPQRRAGARGRRQAGADDRHGSSAVPDAVHLASRLRYATRTQFPPEPQPCRTRP